MKMQKFQMLWADEPSRGEVSTCVWGEKKELMVQPGRASHTTVWPPQKAIKTGWWASI